jgi:hypothetical protein
MLKRMYLLLVLVVFLLSSPLLVYAQPRPPPPGTVVITTFENGTTKVLRSSSTNVLPVTGGYLIVDSSVIPTQPLPAKTVSQNVQNQIYTAISIVYQIIIDIENPPIEPLPPDCPPGQVLQGDGQCAPETPVCPEWASECPVQPIIEPPPPPVYDICQGDPNCEQPQPPVDEPEPQPVPEEPEEPEQPEEPDDSNDGGDSGDGGSDGDEGGGEDSGDGGGDAEGGGA